MIAKSTLETAMAELSPILEEVLAAGGSVELTVSGNSMFPMLLHRKSKVKLTPADQLRRGDIPLYRRDSGAYVLHRIIGLRDGCYVCCGDNQWRPEPGIRPDQVLAVVSHFARRERWVSVNALPYALYWRIWLFIRPVRALWIRGIRWLRRKLG